MHSTRGRARLLFEMLQGDVITDGSRSTDVRDTLDLCLACKGCRSRLPGRRRWRPTRPSSCPTTTAPAASNGALPIGSIPLSAPLAATTPRTVNTVTHADGLRTAVKITRGIDRTATYRASPTNGSPSGSQPPAPPAGRPVAGGTVADAFVNDFDPIGQTP